ncbi:hypothetical protein N7492_002064 [Penicillium capsulatum]|uniref:Uncharacterized protein n=1 Tax=Penicillium capsulatum TaxID=69766 RepID=A0A9W9LVP6_9EURO|nr:hypothetical protein N7492_002064 [Penicillium capsulatum]
MSTIDDTQEEDAQDEYEEPFHDQHEEAEHYEEDEGTGSQNLDPFSQPFMSHDELVTETEERWGFIGGGGGGTVLAWRGNGVHKSVITGYECDGATIARVEKAGRRSIQGPRLIEQYRRQNQDGRPLSIADIAGYGLVAWRVDSKYQDNPTDVLIPMEKAWYPETYTQVYWRDHPLTWESRDKLRGIQCTSNYETDVYIYRLAINQDALYNHRRTGVIKQYPDDNGFMQNIHWRNVNAYGGAYWLQPRARKERRITNISEDPAVDSVHPIDEDGQDPYDAEDRQEGNEIGEQDGEEADAQDSYNGVSWDRLEEAVEEGAPLTPPRSRGVTPIARSSYLRRGASKMSPISENFYTPAAQNSGNDFLHRSQSGSQRLTPNRRVQSQGIHSQREQSGNDNAQNNNPGLPRMGISSQRNTPRNQTPIMQGAGPQRKTPRPTVASSQRATPRNQPSAQSQGSQRNMPAPEEAFTRGTPRNQATPTQGARSQRNMPAPEEAFTRGTPHNQATPTQGARSQRNTPAPAGSQRGTPRSQPSAQSQGPRRNTPAPAGPSSQRSTPRNQATQGTGSQRNTPAPAGSQRGTPRSQPSAQSQGPRRNTPAPAGPSSQRSTPRNQATQGTGSQRNTPAPVGSSRRGNPQNHPSAQAQESQRNTPAPAGSSSRRGTPRDQPSAQARGSRRNTPAPAESSSQRQSAHRPRQGGSTRISAASPTQSPTENITHVSGRRRQRRQPPRPGTRASNRIRQQR